MNVTLRLVINLVTFLSFTGLQISPMMSLKLSDNFELALQTLAQKRLFLMRVISDFDAMSKNW